MKSIFERALWLFGATERETDIEERKSSPNSDNDDDND